jgi:hypothetical protein
LIVRHALETILETDQVHAKFTPGGLADRADRRVQTGAVIACRKNANCLAHGFFSPQTSGSGWRIMFNIIPDSLRIHYSSGVIE